MTIFIQEKHKKIVCDILLKYDYTFYVFGSRVHGYQKDLSDLDLCYKDPIPSHVINKIEEAFEESDLPYKVDIVNWNSCSKEFQDVIQKDMQLFPLL